jgi:hypothetical protein
VILDRIMKRIDETDWSGRRVRLAREAVVDYTRALITRDVLVQRLTAAGWNAAQVSTIIETANKNIRL